jgi:hypothetical protein
MTILLFTAVARVAGREGVVDSSKNPVQALALSRSTEIDLTILHLMRDARGVAWSFSGPGQKRRMPHAVPKTARLRILITLICSFVNKFAHKSLLALRGFGSLASRNLGEDRAVHWTFLRSRQRVRRSRWKNSFSPLHNQESITNERSAEAPSQRGMACGAPTP